MKWTEVDVKLTDGGAKGCHQVAIPLAIHTGLWGEMGAGTDREGVTTGPKIRHTTPLFQPENEDLRDCVRNVRIFGNETNDLEEDDLEVWRERTANACSFCGCRPLDKDGRCPRCGGRKLLPGEEPWKVPVAHPRVYTTLLDINDTEDLRHNTVQEFQFSNLARALGACRAGGLTRRRGSLPPPVSELGGGRLSRSSRDAARRRFAATLVASGGVADRRRVLGPIAGVNPAHEDGTDMLSRYICRSHFSGLGGAGRLRPGDIVELEPNEAAKFLDQGVLEAEPDAAWKHLTDSAGRRDIAGVLGALEALAPETEVVG